MSSMIYFLLRFLILKTTACHLHFYDFNIRWEQLIRHIRRPFKEFASQDFNRQIGNESQDFRKKFKAPLIGWTPAYFYFSAPLKGRPGERNEINTIHVNNTVLVYTCSLLKTLLFLLPRFQNIDNCQHISCCLL